MLRIGIHYDFYEKTLNTEDGPVPVTVNTYDIQAVDEDGHVWVWYDAHTEDQSFAEHQLLHLDHDPFTQPDLWRECSPVYGSNAWDSEAEYELACFEADSFNEPRPRW